MRKGKYPVTGKRRRERRPKRSDRRALSLINRRLKKLTARFFLPRFLREMKRLKIGGLTGGNRLKLLADGDSCFREIIATIRKAKKSINLETYIFNSDALGWKIAELLMEKSRVGVEVNCIYDAIGCIGTSPRLFSALREAGVEVLEYNPFFPWRRYWNLSSRDHRKIIVVDGEIAFIGGINIGDDYAGRHFDGGNWRDTHLKVQGPAVRDIQFFFLENWYRQGGAIIDNGRHFPHIKEAGKKLLMVISDKARRKVRPIRESYISAIENAHHSIYITNAYFIPDGRIYRALIRAARRGVDVRIMLPEKSDVPIVQLASRYLYKRYLKSGVRVYEYTRSVLHAKTAVIDGIWSTVGSSNIDRRSFRKNLEINAIILDQEFGEIMERQFDEDLRHCVEKRLDEWQRRSAMLFALEWIMYRFRNYL